MTGEHHRALHCKAPRRSRIRGPLWITPRRQHCRRERPELNKNAPILTGVLSWGRRLFLRRLWPFCLQSGRRLSGCCRFLILFYQAAHRVGWLCAFADPVFDPINLQITIVTGFLWIVRAEDLDKFPIARTAPVSHYHFVVRAIFGSFSS